MTPRSCPFSLARMRQIMSPRGRLSPQEIEAAKCWLQSRRWVVRHREWCRPEECGPYAPTWPIYFAVVEQCSRELQDLLEPRGWAVTDGVHGGYLLRWARVNRVRLGGHQGRGPHLTPAAALRREAIRWPADPCSDRSAEAAASPEA